MKIKSIISLIFVLIFTFWSCKPESTFQGKHDPDVIKTYRNNATPASMMDSLSSVNFITKQKLTEVYELSSLFASNANDSLMREILLPQIQSYFLENDSITSVKLIQEMDSIQVNFVEIQQMDLPENDSLDTDSIRVVNYDVRYFSDNRKLIGIEKKLAKYILKKEPKQFKHEFIFYFMGFESRQEENDTTLSEVTQ